MRLGSGDGDELSLQVMGYQFPDARIPEQRYSWHVLAGSARAGSERWEFRWPAMTCDESSRVGDWLRDLADVLDGDDPTMRPAPLHFTEPNLVFRAPLGGRHQLEVDVSQEFGPPSHTHSWDVTTLRLIVAGRELREAADSWDRERSPYPDGLPSDAGRSTPSSRRC